MPDAELTSGVRALLEDLHGDLDRCAALVAQEMRLRLPYYAGAEGPFAEQLPAVVRGNVDRLLRQLLIDPHDEDVATEQAYATGGLRARQGVPLEEVVSAFRVGGQVLFAELVVRHRSTGQGSADGLLDAAMLLWREVDREAGSVVAGYRAEITRLAGDRVRQQQALIEGLLMDDGGPRAGGGATRLDGLGLAVGPYCCALVLTAGDVNAPAPEPETLPPDVAAAWAVRGTARVGLLAGPRGSLTQLQARLRPRSGVVVVLSGIFDQLEGFRLQHDLAELAAVTASPGAVHAVADRLPEMLMTAAPDVAAAIRERTTERLAGCSKRERQALVDALRALFAAGGSVTRAARQAHLHRNTLLNRLARVRAVVAHDVTEPGAALLWQLALSDEPN